MKNHALIVSEYAFNKFTKALRAKIRKDGPVICETEDGTLIRVTYFEPGSDKSDPDRGGFEAADDQWCLVWRNNGKSITSSRFNLIEFQD